MAELLNHNEIIKAIAFYLPQFHAIEENDKAWGKGFTEWSNTRKARPLFDGHYQPRIPLNEDYYNPLDEGVMHRQTVLAKQYGIFGFCYYHYWFNGKKLLEKPIEMMLNDKSIDIPFCLSWANENWTRKWDGGSNEIIVEQNYGDKEEWEKHLQYLIPFFNDSRYITYDGKPILIIYKLVIIPKVQKMMHYFKKRVIELGFKGLMIIGQNPVNYFHGKKNQYDFHIMFEPWFTDSELSFRQSLRYHSSIYKVAVFFKFEWVLVKTYHSIKKIFTNKKNTKEEPQLKIKDYDHYWKCILSRRKTDLKLISGAFTDWDNTARNKTGFVYKGSTPEKFGKYMEELVTNLKKENKNIVFINAWNEWAECAYLEPDEQYGYRYLKALKNALSVHI